ncbi:unnamed protein product [Cunninghamella echinulata]
MNHIEFQKVFFSYPSSILSSTHFKNINLMIPRGKITLIHGNVGSGKSTLFKLILKQVIPNKGTILINGININDNNKNENVTSIGLVDAVPHFFNDTVYQNIAFGRQDFWNVTINQVMEVCQLVGLHQTINKLPLKYATLLNDQSTLLSTSEKKQLAIARAIIQNPSILLMDEHTSSTNDDLNKMLFDTILYSRQGKTTIIISHRLKYILDKVDHVIDMNELTCQSDKNNQNNKCSNSNNNINNNNNSRRTIRQSMLALMNNPYNENESFYQDNIYDHDHSPKIIYQPPPRFDSLPSKSRYLRFSHNHCATTAVTISSTKTLLSTHNKDNIFTGSTLYDIEKGKKQENLDQFKWTKYLWKHKSLYSTGIIILYISTILHAITFPYFTIVVARILGYYSIIAKGSGTSNNNNDGDMAQFKILIHQDLLLLITLTIVKSIIVFFNQWYQRMSVKSMVAQLQHDILSIFYLSTTIIDFSFYSKIRNGNYDKNDNTKLIKSDDEKKERKYTTQWNDQLAQKSPMVLDWFFTHYINELLVSSLIILVTIIFSLLKCWKLSLVSFGTLLPLAAFAYLIKIIGHKKYMATYKSKNHHINEILHEIIYTKNTIQILGLRTHFLKKVNKLFNSNLQLSYKLITYISIHFGLIQSIPYFTKVILFWYGTQLILSKEYDPQSVITVWILLSFIITCNSKVLTKISTWSSAKLQFNDMENILSFSSLLTDNKNDAIPSTSTTISTIVKKMEDSVDSICVAELFNITLQTSERILLSNVSIRIPYGKWVGIMGKSGSGKSLVLQTLLNMYGTTTHDIAQDGQIFFNDQAPNSNQIIWRHMFGIVDQEPQFFPISIHDNIAIGSGNKYIHIYIKTLH